LVPDSLVYLARFTLRLSLANVNDRYISLRCVVRRCVQYVSAAQITIGLLSLPINVAEVAIGFELFAGEEIGGALVLK
jgi:uncharacterized protein YebE (UPF0316 family)